MKNYSDKYNLIYNMNTAVISLKEGLRKEFKKNGIDITIDNFAVLIRLWQNNNLTQQQLCELTCKNKSNLTRILDTMEKKDMIKRNPNHEDRRSFTISLTDYSLTLKDKAIETVEKYSNSIFAEVSDSDFDDINSFFSKLNI